MGIMLFLVRRSQGHRGLVEGEGGIVVPSVKNQIEDRLKFKNQCHFHFDTAKVYQLLRLFTITKLFILIQCY